MKPAALGLLLLWLASGVMAADDDLVVRARVTEAQVWVGQRAILQIDVLAADAWAQVANFGRIEMAGAYLLPPRDQGTRLQETIGGQSFTGQRYELFLYPQRAGELQLQAEPLEVRVRRFGAGGGDAFRNVTLPPVSIRARFPPGAEGITGLISTRELRAEQRWEPPVDELKVGDSLRRVIRLQAADVPGMAFRPLRFEAIKGLGVYPAQPRVEDEYHRGMLRGSRIESVTYVAERAGRFSLPAITLTWWDTANERLRRIELPGRALVVSGAAMATEDKHAEERMPFRLLAMLLAAGMVPFLLRHRIAAHWRGWRRARADSEAQHFRRLRAAIRAGDPTAVYRHLMRWLDRIDETNEPARLDDFLERYCDEADRQVMTQLQASLIDGNRLADRRAMLRVLKQARRRWQRRNAVPAGGKSLLPPLNPGAEG